MLIVASIVFADAHNQCSEQCFVCARFEILNPAILLAPVIKSSAQRLVPVK